MKKTDKKSELTALEQLPDDILLRMIGFLPVTQIPHMRKVAKRFQAVLDSPAASRDALSTTSAYRLYARENLERFFDPSTGLSPEANKVPEDVLKDTLAQLFEESSQEMVAVHDKIFLMPAELQASLSSMQIPTSISQGQMKVPGPDTSLKDLVAWSQRVDFAQCLDWLDHTWKMLNFHMQAMMRKVPLSPDQQALLVSLLDLPINIDSDPYTFLIKEAINSQNTDAVKILIEHPKSKVLFEHTGIAEADSYHALTNQDRSDIAIEEARNLLPLACALGCSAAVIMPLLEYSQPDEPNAIGMTPLMLAAQAGSIDAVTLLLNKGANINCCDQAGMTPLLYACENGHQEICELLINHGAKYEAKDRNGETPLIKAVMRGDDTLSNFLIAKGANLGALRANGESIAMIIEMQVGPHEYCDKTIEESEGNSLVTGFHDLNKDQSPQLKLIEKYKDHPKMLSAVDSKGYSPLMLAVMNYINFGESKEIIEALLAVKGLDINAYAINGEHDYTALSWASEYTANTRNEGMRKRGLEMVTLLRRHGAELTVREGRGLPPPPKFQHPDLYDAFTSTTLRRSPRW